MQLLSDLPPDPNTLLFPGEAYQRTEPCMRPSAVPFGIPRYIYGASPHFCFSCHCCQKIHPQKERLYQLPNPWEHLTQPHVEELKNALCNGTKSISLLPFSLALQQVLCRAQTPEDTSQLPQFQFHPMHKFHETYLRTGGRRGDDKGHECIPRRRWNFGTDAMETCSQLEFEVCLVIDRE